MFHRLKSRIPGAWLLPYHRALSWLAAAMYGHPSEKLIVIGVTGTNGKTTTTYFTANALEASGSPTGCTSTAVFKVGDREWLNDTKMTMVGRFALQRLLRGMVDAGCLFAVIETSSQGIVQHRHANINYDLMVFTNLTPEHIEAHGGFEKYKQAKLDAFRHTARSPRKVFNGKTIQKVAVLNARDASSAAFALPEFDRIFWYGTDGTAGADLVATGIRLEDRSAAFDVRGIPATIRMPGRVNVENALAALSVCEILGVPLAAAASALSEIERVPGRFERIEEGQPWTVIVDYAPEPESLERLYDTLSSVSRNRLIHVLGSAGGGRDVARRPIIGRMAGERADVVIVTNEDPYDDDPRRIMEQVADGAREVGNIDGQNLFIIEDRRDAIREAMRRAAPGDLVLLTGKGSEQAICVAGGRKIPWDEREEARKAIREVVGGRS
ncbi:UDP-N-acetylmuramyl-tripeptide synthetase [Candidatus Uhrbacteria bacterium]|nr:UDP-N-acetylmuramyl-tripeptide synthetase [Candidatus Uhrbacteria bacterium]